ncbi:MAG: YihY/virulence factor BrkB family protein [Pseudomonadota bacterium]|nr:YihY/virulence factor BrkB family protein [Pseudomonadota bacterium]
MKNIVKRSLISWFEDEASSMGAAIAFYTLFSIAPILLIVIWIAGAFITPDAVQTHVLAQMQMLLGKTAAEAVQTLLASARYSGKSAFSTAVGIVTLLVGATSVFAELQNSLNRVWRTPTTKDNRGVLHALRGRLLSFGLVLGVGFLLLVSLIISAALEGIGAWLGVFMTDWHQVVVGLDVMLGFAISTVLFAMIYKYVPREQVTWGDVWVGALVTATLFTIGKLVIVVYLGRVAFASAYGAAGSFVVLLLWVYYSAQIFLLGAEFTYSYAYEQGSRLGLPEQRDLSGRPEQRQQGG